MRTLRTRWQQATEEQAMRALLAVWRRHGHETFPLNPRLPGTAGLLMARHLGWVFGDGGAVNVTLAGLRVIGDHFGRDLLEDWIEAERIAASEPAPWEWAEAA